MYLIKMTSSRWRYVLGALAVAWLNLYIIRDVFFLVHSARMNAMHGFWMAMARLSESQWWSPGWWPWGDGGAPFEFIYAPLTPGLMALWSHLGSVPTSRAYFGVTALYYLLGPLTLYVFSAWFLRSAGVATAVAFCYTLISPSSLLVPDAQFGFHTLLNDRRAYLMGVWDDTPHIAALVILPVLWIFLIRALQHRRRLDIVLAVALMSLEVVASAFGPVLVTLSGICLCFTLTGREGWLRNLLLCFCMGSAAWLIACPWLSPSLIDAIAVNAKAHGDTVWNLSALTTVSMIILAWVLIRRILPNGTEAWRTHFVTFFALVITSIPTLSVYMGRGFVPQAGRYRLEMDLAWALLLVVVARKLWQRMPLSVAVAVSLVLLSFGAEQVVHHRRYVKNDAFKPADITGTLDYSLARFVDANLPPGGRVFLPGSMGPWFNALSDRAQFSGSSWSTAYNQVQQQGVYYLYSSDRSHLDKNLLWLKAYAVQAVVVPGKDSPETWHPYQQPDKFDDALEVIWKERDTTMYRVPLKSLALAHLVREGSIVKRPPANGEDTDEIAQYVGDLDNPSLPGVAWEWTGPGSAVATAESADGQALSFQVSYHPGWKAKVNGEPVSLHSDGLGLMWLKPPRPGALRVELEYDGGREALLLRILSFTAFALLCLYGVDLLRMERFSRRPGLIGHG